MDITPFLGGLFIGYFAFSLALAAFLSELGDLFKDEKPDQFGRLMGCILLGFILWIPCYWAYKGDALSWGIIVATIWANLISD